MLPYFSFETYSTPFRYKFFREEILRQINQLRFTNFATDSNKMGIKTISIKLPTDYSEQLMRKQISRQLGIREFTFRTESKSLDARNKRNIFWQLRVVVDSPQLKGNDAKIQEDLLIPYKKRKKKIVVVGSGPAGFFNAFVLQKAGFDVTLIERGSDVKIRGAAITDFEQGGAFSATNNYAFGEGGAGTFSDGKLTSRSKHISKEKLFILKSYVEAGAPQEILYMTHPHLGTDNLRKIVVNLRNEFEKLGGTFLFNTLLEDLRIMNGKVNEAITSAGSLETDAVFIAPGHSAYETYRMLIRNGVPFRTKNFAVGSRMEHRQETINLAQWGQPTLPGVKAAEYRLTSQADGQHPVFSFCMCPGGTVVPAAAYAETNIVNGMSYYNRGGNFANAACVAGIHPDELAGKTVSPLEALNQLQKLEEQFFNYAGGYSAPFCSIRSFLAEKERAGKAESSFPLGLLPAPLWTLLPKPVVESMKVGLQDFIRKMNGFQEGNLLGFESKTSAPIQVIREKNSLAEGFENLYIIGEGSGYTGGIVSSAADGIRAALSLVET